jgi:hypothetical protein
MVGFSARFFQEGSNRGNILSFNLLRATQTQKNEKTRKKMVFLKRGPPVFLPNGPQKGSFFLSVRFLGRGQCGLLP